jgi:hypothetical protein
MPVWFSIPNARDLVDLREHGESVVGVDDDRERRMLSVLGRLVLGAMIELDDPAHKGRVARGAPHGATGAKHRSGAVPSSWVFQIQREVKVDARPYVREYVEAGSRSLKVQSFVRGHMKRQRHGPQGSLRKWIHIQPYWKGPEDAPVALRVHKVGS